LADRQNLFFIAFVDADAAGYVYAEVVQQRETSRHYAYSMIYIQQISVRTQFQGLGVGKALMSVVQSAGEDIGVTILALDV
jgi:ribosomal protein S18 acetylase RimI-like enzyme